MADVYLDEGKAWLIHDYDGLTFTKTLNHQDLSDIDEPNAFVRRQHSTDLNFPYIGFTPRYALTAALSDGAVISTDQIKTDYHDTGIISGSEEKDTLSEVDMKDFKNAFGEKYQNFESANILITDSGGGAFGKGPQPPDSLYTSSADLTVVAYEDDLDESYNAMLKTRDEVEEDLKRLADKFL